MASIFVEAWRQRRSVTLDQPSALPWLDGVAANAEAGADVDVAVRDGAAGIEVVLWVVPA